MKAKLSFLITLFIISAFAVSAQQFEGVITMTSSEMEDGKMVFSVKGDKVLMEINSEGQNIRMLSDRKSSNMTMLFDNDGKKVALIMGPETMNMMGQGNNTSVNSDGVDIKVTNEKKVIDGYNCYKVTGKDKESEIEAWITNDLNFSFMDLVPMSKNLALQQGGSMISVMEKGFVMEGTEKEIKTGKVSTIKANVVAKKLDADRFNYSSEGYQEFDMTNMMKLMQEIQSDPEKAKEFEEIMKAIEGN